VSNVKHIYVKVLKPVDILGKLQHAGAVLRVTADEARLQLKHRSLVEVPRGTKSEDDSAPPADE